MKRISSPSARAVRWARASLLAVLMPLVTACASDQVLTAEERALQSRVEGMLAQALFVRQLDDHASYNVHPDGFVVIRFDESVTMPAYTELVEWLRAQPEVKGVRATQMGVEVCPVRR